MDVKRCDVITLLGTNGLAIFAFEKMHRRALGKLGRRPKNHSQQPEAQSKGGGAQHHQGGGGLKPQQGLDEYGAHGFTS